MADDWQLGQSLINAAFHGRCDLLEELIQQGVRETYINEAMLTAASRNPKFTLAIARLGAGDADHTTSDTPASAFFHVAIRDPCLGWQLFQLGAGKASRYKTEPARRCLVWAAMSIGHDTLDVICAQGVDVDSRGRLTALYQSNSRGTLQKLIDLGADINAIADRTSTPVLLKLNPHESHPELLFDLVSRGGWICQSVCEQLNTAMIDAVKEIDEATKPIHTRKSARLKEKRERKRTERQLEQEKERAVKWCREDRAGGRLVRRCFQDEGESEEEAEEKREEGKLTER
ncbi:MAG TPA: hypothetical protein V6C97_27465, partial [Oculatellaceae cyanobacterium]